MGIPSQSACEEATAAAAQAALGAERARNVALRQQLAALIAAGQADLARVSPLLMSCCHTSSWLSAQINFLLPLFNAKNKVPAMRSHRQETQRVQVPHSYQMSCVESMWDDMDSADCCAQRAAADTEAARLRDELATTRSQQAAAETRLQEAAAAMTQERCANLRP